MAEGPPSKKTKTPAQRKKLFEKWGKALTRLSAKAKVVNPYPDDPYSVEVKETTPWSPAEFESLFGGQGRKIQPTADNKPTSQTTILKFDDFASIKAFFGEAKIKKDGYTAGFWRSRNFQKSFKMSDGPTKLNSLEVQ